MQEGDKMVKLGLYKGLEIKLNSKPVSVTLDEVNAKKEALLKSYATNEVTEGPLENGHISTIDFCGSVDGVKFDGGSAEGYELEIGSGAFIPGFEEQMVGMVKGESRVIKVKFPENYHANLAGKDAEFEVKLHEIKKKVTPKMNDELAKKIAEDRKLEGVETVEALDKALMSSIYREKQEKINDEIAEKLEKMLLDGCECDVLQEVVDAEVEGRIKELEAQASAYQMPLETLLSFMGIPSLDELKVVLRESAENKAKMDAILIEIAKEEKLEVKKEEIDAYFEFASKQHQKSVEEIKAVVPEQAVELMIKASMAYNLVTESARVTFA